LLLLLAGTAAVGAVTVFGGGTVLGGWLVYNNAGAIAAGAARLAADAIIDDIDGLSAAERQLMKDDTNRLIAGLETGQISEQDLVNFTEELVTGPLGGLVVVAGVSDKYFGPAGLSDDEKARADRALERVARGLSEDELGLPELAPLISRVTEVGPDGETQPKDQLTHQELMDLVADAEKLANDKNIPDEAFVVDIPAAFDKAVDEALAP
jgi:hypothetical protein